VTPPRRRPRAARALLVLLLAACGAEPADGDAPGGGELPSAWTVAPAGLRIGAAEDGSDALAFVTAAVRLPHGDIAVADAGSHRVDVFDAAGHRVRSLGREGRGPGELSHPSWLGVRGDTLLVWDMVQSRLTRFDTAGTLMRTDPPLTGLGSFARVFGQRDDGSLLAAASASAEWRPGAYRDSMLVVWIRPDGRRDTVASVPGDEQFGTRSADGRVSESTTRPFGRRTLVAAQGRRVYVGTADAPAILATLDGRAWDTVASLPGAPPAVTRKDVDDYWALLLASGTRSPAGPPEGVEYPARFPPYGDLRVAPDARVWVALPVRPSEWSVGSRWLVFAPDGALMVRVEVPGRTRMLQVTDRWILVVDTDPDGRQTVIEYALSPS
jgi:hypothetical protein